MQVYLISFGVVWCMYLYMSIVYVFCSEQMISGVSCVNWLMSTEQFIERLQQTQIN